MATVMTATVIRDRMPRRLWELRTQCGHTNYELVEQMPKPPVEVLCRVCQAEARLAAFRARVASWASRRGQGIPPTSQPVLSGTHAEGIVPVGTMPFELDGGLDVRLADPAPPRTEGAPQQAEGVPVEAEIPPAGRVARPLGPLPECMRVRPGSLVPGSGILSSGQGAERIGLQPGRGPGRGRGASKGASKAQDHVQGRLFEG